MAIRTMYDCFDEASLPSSWAQKYGSKSARCVSERVRFLPHDILLRVRDEVGQAQDTLASTKSNKKGNKFGMPLCIDAGVCLRYSPRHQRGGLGHCTSIPLLDTFGESPAGESTENASRWKPDPRTSLKEGCAVRPGHSAWEAKHLWASPFTEAGGDLSTTRISPHSYYVLPHPTELHNKGGGRRAAARMKMRAEA